MDEGRRQSLTMVVAVLIVGGALVAYETFLRDDGGAPSLEQTAPVPEPAAAPARPASPAGPDPARLEGLERTAILETDRLVAVVSNLNAGLASVRLKGEQFVERDGEGHDVVTTDRPRYRPFQVELAGVPMPETTVWTVERATADAVELRWKGGDVTVTRRFEAGRGPYQIFSTTRVENHGSRPLETRLRVKTYHYVERAEEEGGFFGAPGPGTSQAICLWQGKVERHDREADEILVEGDAFERAMGWGPEVRFVGVENRYFANVLVAPEERVAQCRLASSDRGQPEAVGSLFEARLSYPEVTIPPDGSYTARTLGYFGPKDPEALRAAGHELPRVVDLGFFAIIAGALVDLLAFIHEHVGNWGLAIILLTLLVRTVLFPLTVQSFKSMARMRLLKPEMDRLNELYADDREKKGAALMELYRKHKINPLAGCLPQLLQLPIWWALYTSLSTNFQLYHAPFALWWTDLSAPDPYFVLPLSVGGLIFAQQKLTPTAMDPAQARIMLYVMPAMITSFMLFLPAGLCLYIATNSVLGIAQQKWIEHRLERSHAAAASSSPSGAPGADDGDDDDDADGLGPVERGSSSTLRTRKPDRRRKRRARP